MWRRPARMRGRPIKPHTSAQRALPLARVSCPLRLLFDVVNILLHDGCRLRDFLALLEFPALLPNLLIYLRKLLIEIRFFCQQGFAWNAASIQNLFCIVIFCFSRFKSGEGSFCCQRVKELLVFFLADVQNRALLGKLCDLILCLLQAGGQIICRGDIVLLQELQTRFVNISQ